MRGGGCSRTFTHTYDDIISVENLLAAWSEFRRGKRYRADVLEFQSNLMSNILQLHNDLSMCIYHHGGYEHFVVTDPKRRDIHKASVRDRLVHHAMYRILYPYFDARFIHDSYSCRNNKGTHKAISQFQNFVRKVSENNTRTVYVLKCDIRKFFASIDHEILVTILEKQIPDRNIINLLKEVIGSFNSGIPGTGLPLGNLTSQLLVNIYLNEFDQFVKHALKAKFYIRYADDFVFLHHDRHLLVLLLQSIGVYLDIKLRLKLHPNKVVVGTVAAGVDFLGWIQFSHHRVLRTVTRRRAMDRLQESSVTESVRQSYLGLLSHGDTYGLSRLLARKDDGT